MSRNRQEHTIWSPKRIRFFQLKRRDFQISPRHFRFYGLRALGERSLPLQHYEGLYIGKFHVGPNLAIDD